MKFPLDLVGGDVAGGPDSIQKRDPAGREWDRGPPGKGLDYFFSGTSNQALQGSQR